MNISEDKIREIAIAAIESLGDKATPDSVRQYVENQLASQSAGSTASGDSSSGRVIITAYGKNTMGIVSSITQSLSNCHCDILDISQKIMQEFFTMIMMVDISRATKNLAGLQEELGGIAKELHIKIHLQHEDIFRFMHRV